MPSGAKKRKAAKKKKGTQPTNNPNPPLASTQGGGDVKHQDDRQSDVGEASSTTSQEHPSHHDLLTEGEEEHSGNREENASNLPKVEGVNIKGDDKHEVQIERNAIQAEREFKIEGEFGGKVEHDENERKSYDGGPSGSSSSSSSDDESHRVETSHAASDKAPIPVEGDHSLHKENTKVVPSITIGEANEAVVDSIPPVVSDNVSLLSESVEDGEKKGYVEEASVPPVEKVPETSDPKKCTVEETDERLSLSYNAPTAIHDNGADTGKDSGVTEPLLVPQPCAGQRTSWKGCCGLFELFTGSDR